MSGYVTAFKSREMTGAKVFEACDGALVDDMLTDEGNQFAQYYFDFEGGKYLSDYQELLGKGLPTIYHVADTWEKLKRLSDEEKEQVAQEVEEVAREFFPNNEMRFPAQMIIFTGKKTG